MKRLPMFMAGLNLITLLEPSFVLSKDSPTHRSGEEIVISDTTNHILDSRTGEPIEVTIDKDDKYYRTIMEVFQLSQKRDKTSLLIVKNERKLYLLSSGDIVDSCIVGLSRNPIGAKQYQGDGRIPEGRYEISSIKDGNNGTRSNFGLALLINYPNYYDRARFNAALRNNELPVGVNNLGGDIEIHLGPDDIDWTQGCIAVEKEGMEKILEKAYEGMPVGIVGYVPFNHPWNINIYTYEPYEEERSLEQ